MAYFRQLETKALLSLFHKEDSWLILINADPDALASAMALKRIMGRKVGHAAIAHVNEIARPDNLTMIKQLRIPTKRLRKRKERKFTRFALVDSQPHHHPSFAPYHFSLVIDHHPLVPEHPVDAAFKDIRPGYGATATMLAEYLYGLKIKPARNLATALIYAIKSDTRDFERPFVDADVKAFRWLQKFADQNSLRKIVRSEFMPGWLKYFSSAIDRMEIMGQGAYVYMGEVDSPDILVILADFFLRVHSISWTVIAGVVREGEPTLVAILRGDGIRRDVGRLAKACFSDVGSAGGHSCAARAEIPLTALRGEEPGHFLRCRLDSRRDDCDGKEIAQPTVAQGAQGADHAA